MNVQSCTAWSKPNSQLINEKKSKLQQPGSSQTDTDKETPARARNADYLANLHRFAKNLAKAEAIPMQKDGIKGRGEPRKNRRSFRLLSNTALVMNFKDKHPGKINLNSMAIIIYSCK